MAIFGPVSYKQLVGYLKLYYFTYEFRVSYLSEIPFYLQLFFVHIKIVCMACGLLLWDVALLM